MTPRVLAPLTAAALVAAACATAPGDTSRYYAAPRDPLAGDFRYAAGAISCIPGPEDFDGFGGCLHIGGVRVAQELAAVEEMTGPPVRTEPAASGGETRVYAIDGPQEHSAGEPRATAFLAVTYVAGLAAAIELSGDARSETYSFSSLGPGSTVADVLRVLGPPKGTAPGRTAAATVYDYRPYPITVELRDARVVAIRIRR